LIARYTRTGYLGESGFYADNWPDWRRANDALIASMLRGETPVPTGRSHEYASTIIEAIECGREASIHGNVRNRGWVDNLPDGCVEVECRAGRDGVKPVPFGPLPEQLAALNRSHMAVHELVVQSLLERDRQKAKYALMLDPLTAAVCSLDEIDRLFDEMWEAESKSLTAFDSDARA
jgi:alpha-galactosidase